MMTMNLEQVRNVIAETLGCDVEAVTMEAKLQEDLGADSLAAMELMMALEEATGVAIADEAMPGMKTVADIVGCLSAK
ncbi:MAG: acyl carrier protein [Aristaeellaceae bacterium]